MLPARMPRLLTKLNQVAVSSKLIGTATVSLSALRSPRRYDRSAISVAPSCRLLASKRAQVPPSTTECTRSLLPTRTKATWPSLPSRSVHCKR